MTVTAGATAMATFSFLQAADTAMPRPCSKGPVCTACGAATELMPVTLLHLALTPCQHPAPGRA